jgi:hypothetical protein
MPSTTSVSSVASVAPLTTSSFTDPALPCELVDILVLSLAPTGAGFIANSCLPVFAGDMNVDPRDRKGWGGQWRVKLDFEGGGCRLLIERKEGI